MCSRTALAIWLDSERQHAALHYDSIKGLARGWTVARGKPASLRNVTSDRTPRGKTVCQSVGSANLGGWASKRGSDAGVRGWALPTLRRGPLLLHQPNLEQRRPELASDQ